MGWLVLAQSMSLTGSSATRFALGLAAFSADHRVADLAWVLVAGFVPGLVLTPLVGLGIDRLGPLRFVVLGDLLGAGVVAALLAAPEPGRATIALAAAGFSVASALQTPAVSAIVPRLVSSAELPAANGAVAAAGSIAQLLGPAIGAGLVGAFGLPVVLGLDLASYALAAGLVLARWGDLRDADGGRPGAGSAWGELAEGARDLGRRRELLRFVSIGTAFNFVYAMYGVVAQPFVLGFASERVLGALYAVFAVGMLAGGASAGRLGSRSAMTGMVWMVGVLGAAMAVGGLARTVPVVAGCWLASGAGLALLGSWSNTVLQRSTPVDRHGRLFSTVQVLAWCVLPVGQVLAGWLADRVFGPEGLGALMAGLGVGLVALAAGASRMSSLWRLEQQGVPA
ncbi:MAG: MFS transporter [Myxococcota bacterium]